MLGKRRTLPAIAALTACLGAARVEAQSNAPGRGPSEIRDDQLFAQPRLTLPAISPETTPAGRWSLRLSGLWSNSFAWSQDRPGENPTQRTFLIDGETVTLDATVRRGLTRNLDVAVRVPFRWRGGGILDGVIDTWHRLIHAPDGDRPSFLRNAFRLEGRTSGGGAFSWTDRAGGGLGDAEIEARWRLADGGDALPSLALVTRASLPTGSGVFAGHGLGGAGQLVLGAPLGRRFDLYAGVGASVQRPGPLRAIEYATSRAHGFLAVEWRPWQRASFVVETNAASRLVRNVADYPGTHWLVNVTSRIDVSPRTRLDLGFTENLKNQISTTDFAVYAALALRP